MRNKILATLIVLGIMGLVALFFWSCMNIEGFGVITLILVFVSLGSMCVVTVLCALWSAIYDSLRD